MEIKHRRSRSLWLIFSIFIFAYLTSGCELQSSNSSVDNPLIPGIDNTATPFQPLNTLIPTPENTTIYLSKSIPEKWVVQLKQESTLKIVDAGDSANLFLSLTSSLENQKEYGQFIRVFAAVVQFPTVTDEVSMDDLQGLWKGNTAANFDILAVSQDTANLLEELWSHAPSSLVHVMLPEDLLDEAWKSTSIVAIIPFEEISPRWKVLKLNGISPLDKPMNISDYPMAITYHLIGNPDENSKVDELATEIVNTLPATNRDESLMTVVVMSGTTALVRTTAYKIEARGTDYPISEIKDWFLSADIRHVSNEISINRDCPDPDPYAATLQFCTKKEYLPVLQGLGINVVELTGNHLNDYGPEKLTDTINLYNQLGMSYFGGGLDLQDAKKPLKMTMNGNKIAFIGCNAAGPGSDFATDTQAGSAPCDLDYFYSQIKQLKADGFTVIGTYQYYEIYEYMFDAAYQKEFHEAAQAGADIIQGSQAHYPMGFEFIGNSLIHYGLGNLLFDQMDYPVVGTRREFVDRHIIYDGEYINTELLTAYLTDYSKPIPMTEEQRFQFLTDIFSASKMR